MGVGMGVGTERVQLPTCDINLHLARTGADGVGCLADVGPRQAVVDRSPEEEGSVLGLHALGQGAIQPAGWRCGWVRTL